MAGDGPYLVKAIHNFKGTNNDELCFTKGDILTVTQVVEGGWWEGTLNGITGWFPSNYVKEYKPESSKFGKVQSKPFEQSLSSRHNSMKLYRSMVFKDIFDTETNFVHELKNILDTYLFPLKRSDLITEKDFSTLTGNIVDVLACHKNLLTHLEGVKEQQSKEQRIGGAFMQVASQMKALHLDYCSNHPKAVQILEKFRDTLGQFMEDHKATPPGILVLTTGLSCPFRRLEKYPALLTELQRHTEESHVDRGDTQRSVFVYKDIANTCSARRKQMEMELEVMTRPISGWEGEDIHTLGEILHMGPVVVLGETGERKDRYLVLFPSTLVMLSLINSASNFHYEGKYLLCGLTVSTHEAGENSRHIFEIHGTLMPHFTILCHSLEELEQWCSLFQQQITTGLVSGPVTFGKNQVYLTHVSSLTSSHGPSPPPHQNVITERCHTPDFRNNSIQQQPSKVWTMWSLRPHPPQRPCLTVTSKEKVVLRRNNSKRKEKSFEIDVRPYEGDMKILQVIEAYCSSAKTRYTVNSSLLDSPQVIIAEEEKIIDEEIRGNMAIVEEKSLVDTVYALKDQVRELKNETRYLVKGLEEERKARRKLEVLLKQHVLTGKENIISGYLEE